MNLFKKIQSFGKKALIVPALLSSIYIGGCDSQTKTIQYNPPQGNPPAGPSITQITSISQEPNRRMHLIIRDESDNEDGFNLEKRIQGQENFFYVADLPANIETYDDWGVEMATHYNYRVRAYNEFGSSDWGYRSGTSSGPETSEIYCNLLADTHVKLSDPERNFGSQRYITVGGINGYWGGYQEGLLKFSLPNIPPYGEFESAELRLCEAGGGNTEYPGLVSIAAGAAADPWDENTVNWNNGPGTFVGTFGYGLHNPNLPEQRCVNINVSTATQRWYNGEIQNNGFVLIIDNSSYCDYYSKEGYADGAAELKISYSW